LREAVKTDKAPAALGPYSQAIKVRGGTFVFCSGQIALDPGTGNLVGTTAADQTAQIMENLKAVLEASGAHMTDIVRTTIFLADMNDFASVNEVYGRYFTQTPPARATVQVSRLPKDGRVEIDAIAVLP
jgi:2-iminobutanoate/2-iminopropanoate deaminase